MSTSKKTVLITGCTPGGIGHALAQDFHAQGLHVIATARDKEKISDLEALGLTTLSLEVTSLASILAAKNAISELTGGGLDILVNNAGRNYTVPALDIDMEEVKLTFQTNLFAIMEITQHFIPLLIASKGLIVNIGSMAGVIPYVFGSAYNASKAALHSYSATLRLELEPYDVRVMVVVTGGVQSNIARTNRSLPPRSLYLPINDSYQRRLKHSQEGAMSNEKYARGVVSAALKTSPRKLLWRGNKTWLVWFAITYLGAWIFDLFLPRMFQLDKLKAMVGILCSTLGSDPKSTNKDSKWSSAKNMSDYCLYLMSDIVSDAVFAQPFRTITTTENRYILHLVHRTYEWIGIIFQAPKIAKYGLDSYMIRGLAQDRQQLRSCNYEVVCILLSILQVESWIQEYAEEAESGAFAYTHHSFVVVPTISLLGRHRLLAPSASIRVSPICLGGMSLGTHWKGMMGECMKENAFELLDTFYDLGGNFIDTANVYQSGQSEEWIGEWMKKNGRRDQMVITTKYTMGHMAGQPVQQSNFGGTGTKSMYLAIEASLKSLQTDYVDLCKILYLGISDTPAWVVVKANCYAREHGLRPFSVYPGRYSAHVRDLEADIIPMCQDEGMAIHAWGVMGNGYFGSPKATPTEGQRQTPFITTGHEAQVSEALNGVAKRLDVPITSVAIAYVMHKAPYMYPIVGGRKVEQLKADVEALSLQLSPQDIADVEKGYDFDPGFPHTIINMAGKAAQGQKM